jgi:hypothetical protein
MAKVALPLAVQWQFEFLMLELQLLLLQLGDDHPQSPELMRKAITVEELIILKKPLQEFPI